MRKPKAKRSLKPKRRPKPREIRTDRQTERQTDTDRPEPTETDLPEIRRAEPKIQTDRQTKSLSLLYDLTQKKTFEKRLITLTESTAFH